MPYSHLDESNGHKSFQLPGSRPHYNPDRPGQVEHISLDLVLDIPNSSFTGTCAIRLNPVRNAIESLTLDAVDLKIDRIEIDGTDCAFNYDGELLHIPVKVNVIAGKILDLVIYYGVTNPQRGLYFIHPDEHYPDKPTQIWTQGEDEDSRFWFPCFDYPGQLATSAIRVQVPKDFVAISNGELVEQTIFGEDRVYQWMQKEIHPTYLMTLAVGRFSEISDSWNGKPVTYYVEKGLEASAKLSMGKTPQMIEFFSEKFGYLYPFPKYAQVCVADFIFGGMENTSTTLLMDRCLLDERASLDNFNTESLVAHELAHQWFGDLVVIKHWSHAWIKEGMASYCEVLWTEHEYDKDEAAYYLLGEAQSYLSEDSDRYRRPIVTNIYREAIELYDRHLYEKGACVYHMIRAELGDELFDRFVHTFVNDNAHKTVETIDLLRAIDKSTGRNLAFLFDQYVYRGGHPDYKVAYSWDGDSKLAKLTVTQTQAKEGVHILTNDLFDLKIPIGFGYVKDGVADVKVTKIRVYEKEQVLYFPLETKPDFISFDVGNNYLKTVTLEYPLPELKAQLKSDPDPISRIYATEAIAKKGNLEAVTALTECLATEKFWAVRLEAAQQLATIKLDLAVTNLVAKIGDEDAFVRRAIVDELGKIKTPETYAAIKQLVEAGDASYYVEAAACRALGGMTTASLKDKQEEVITLLTEVLNTRAGWNEIVRAGAIGGLSKITDSETALNTVIEYVKPGVPQPLRLTSIRALGTISNGQSEANLTVIVEKLAELARETFFLTQVSVVNALSQMSTVKAIGVLQGLANQSPDGRVKRIADEGVQKVQKKIGSDGAVKQLREELEEVKKTNQELKSRLENLEAKSK
ncbi:M1 family metallopeptidase [Chamaesiphon sp. OTE_75_metabat_556]|uniref:M1 family metallopeptidase n=1 Tax=Chamaesiphon sp. OTE_75_metabat_556 TaxID=2964692 RepID=UPI00286D114A|nr:M1 family metallopeptidase [Chamaesiphon sp. OTE_75_metabat_556]